MNLPFFKHLLYYRYSTVSLKITCNINSACYPVHIPVIPHPSTRGQCCSTQRVQLSKRSAQRRYVQQRHLYSCVREQTQTESNQSNWRQFYDNINLILPNLSETAIKSLSSVSRCTMCNVIFVVAETYVVFFLFLCR